MKEKLEWTEAYSIHNKKIDQQHQQLFNLCNQMQELQEEQEELEKIKKTVVALYEYVKTHFSYEQEYMASIHYPLLEPHIALHEEIVHKMNEYMRHSSNMAALVYKFKALVYEWATEHIMQQDKEIDRFVQKRQPAKAEASAEEVEGVGEAPKK